MAEGAGLTSARRAYRLSRRVLGRARRDLRMLIAIGQLQEKLAGRVSYENLPPEMALRLTYQIMLGREPDQPGLQFFLSNLASGTMQIGDVPQAVRGSEEFQNQQFGGHMLGFSIHAGRSQFIKSLPKAARVVDLGGTHLRQPEGALYWLGYPYHFDELTVVDLPPDDRHVIYQAERNPDQVETDHGPVRYQYHSMTDLSAFDDASIDLVYSGQSFEHVTPADGKIVLKEAMRILRPGGRLAIDTPNARVTRIQQGAFIDPDHKVEYTYPELSALLTEAGFEIESAKGLNLAEQTVSSGVFDANEVASNCGLFDQLEDCYILCVVARKPN